MAVLGNLYTGKASLNLCFACISGSAMEYPYPLIFYTECISQRDHSLIIRSRLIQQYSAVRSMSQPDSQR